MKLRGSWRRVLLWGALALTLVAVIASDEDRNVSTELVAPIARSPSGRAPGQVVSPASNMVERLDPGRLEARYEDWAIPDLMAPRSWAPPPPPPPPAPKPIAAKPQPPVPPPPPTAPPLPFRYAGRLVGWSEKPHVYLLRGSETLTVSPGETIAPSYRLESVSDTTLTFVYLPLNQTQTISIPQK